MAILIIGCILTITSWVVAWGRFGVLTEFSFFPLWLGYILTMNGLAEVFTGSSLLTRMRWSFGWLFVISVPFWWFFEGMNEDRPELELSIFTTRFIYSVFNPSLHRFFHGNSSGFIHCFIRLPTH